MAKTSIIAHRGVNREAPENTLPAFEKCLENGFDIELDPKRTKDGVWVVMHDVTVDRTTDGHGLVTELTLEELRKMDAGSWFHRDFKGVKIPALEEVLELVKGKATLYLNFTMDDLENEDYQKEIASLLGNYEGIERAPVTFTRPDAAKSFKKLNPKIQIPADDTLFPMYCGRTLEYALENPKDYRPSVDYVFGNLQDFPYIDVLWTNEVDLTSRISLYLTPELVERAHGFGKTVVFGYLYMPERWKDLIEMGIDGILTNGPRVLKRLLDDPVFNGTAGWYASHR